MNSAGIKNNSHADVIQQVRHYWDLFWRWKWYVVISGLIAVLITGTIVATAAVKEPLLSAKALIGLEHTEDLTAVHDMGGMVQAQSDLIQSRTFLEDIVKRLSLRLVLDKYFRSDIFDSVSVDTITPEGSYYYSVNENEKAKFRLLFLPRKKNSVPVIRTFLGKPVCILQGNVADVSRINLGGLCCIFSRRFLHSPHDFVFQVVDNRNAVEMLLKRLSVKEADPSRRQFNIAVSVDGHDYPLIAEIANAIADAFVEKSASFRKRRAQSVLAALEKQLETVKQDYAGSEEILRSYRTSYPTVGLSEDVRQRVTNLSQMESGMYNGQRAIDDASELMDKISSAVSDDKVRFSSEILVFLAGKGNSSAPVLQTELNQLLAEQRELQRNYAADHPMRTENQRKIDALEKDIEAALKGYIAGARAGLANRTSDIQNLSVELQRLPSRELQLAELQRKQQIAADIYSTVLSRYNQAKAADAAEIAEAYVMDSAVPPIPLPPEPVKLLAIVLLFGAMIAFGPPLVFDYFDPTVRTDYDFKKKVGKQIFEKIPKMPHISKRLLSNANAGKPSVDGAQMLVADLLPNTFFHESIRILRTKVMLTLEQTGQKVICISSLDSECGKSFVAANLASLIARQEIPVVLVDADLRCGTLYKSFGCSKTPGLSDVLMSPGMVDTADDGFVQKSLTPFLSCVASGEPARGSSELLASKKFTSIIEALKQKFTVVVIDTPPMGAVPDAAVIAPIASQYLLIVKAGRTNVHDLEKKISEYPMIGKRLMGYILNYTTGKQIDNYYNQSKYNVLKEAL